MPIETIGSDCEIECIHDLDEVPLLVDVITMAFLKENYIALHASAFRYNGKSILLTGWEKCGKTGALLSFINRGAKYIGDELILISGDDRRMHGLPTPIAIGDWQLKFIGNISPPVRWARKMLFRCIRLLEAGYKRFSAGKLGNIVPLEIPGKALPMLRRQLKNRYTPHKLFRDSLFLDQSGPDKVFLMINHTDSKP